MSAAENKAVFLSYASQDAEAARKICEALRSEGVEVWFDADGGLEHGDEWDAKIRRQIKECVLFIPIISANTQAREEGYFRIEWDLAAERARGIASGVAFILPVVVDDTREPDALVPDRFRTVQWTKLPGGVVTAEVKARYLKLWSHRVGAVKAATDIGRGLPTPPSGLSSAEAAGSGDPALHRKVESERRSRRWLVPALVGAVLVGAAAWIFIPRSHPSNPTPKPPTPDAKPTAARWTADAWPRDPELRRARQLIYSFDAIGEDFRLADDIVQPLLAQHPNDPDTTVVAADVAKEFLIRGFDPTVLRRAQAQKLAERAVQLAPENPHALVALGATLRFLGAQLPRAEELLRRAIELNPDDPRAYRVLREVLVRTQGETEAAAFGERMVARFPRDPLVYYDLARGHKDANRLAEMEQNFDKVLELAPIAFAMVWKGWIALEVHGDVAGFKAWLDRVPQRQRVNTRYANALAIHGLIAGQPGAAIKHLNDLPDSWLADFDFTGPKALLLADLLTVDGRPDLARVQYEIALTEIEREIARNPTDSRPRRALFWTLLGLGRREEARAAYQVVLQMLPRPYQWTINNSWWSGVIRGALLLGDRETALTLLKEATADAAGRLLIRHNFALDPRMAPFRNDPEIGALIAEPAKGPRNWPKDPELKRAIALLEGHNAIADDFLLAEEIARRAIDKAPADPETVTVMARVESAFLLRNFDFRDERSAAAKRYGERALQLAPDEPEALYALATYLRLRGGDPARGETLLRRACELAPQEPRYWRELMQTVSARDRVAGIALAEETITRFPRDPLTHYEASILYRSVQRWTEWERELDSTLALAPIANAFNWKARAAFMRGDLTGTADWLKRVPPRARGEERTVLTAVIYALFSGDFSAGRQALQAFPETWFRDVNNYGGPKALLAATLFDAEGKTELARAQYAAALAELQRRKAEDPADRSVRVTEPWILRGLGRIEEARAANRLFFESRRRPLRMDGLAAWWFDVLPAQLLLGERANALVMLREAAEADETRAVVRLRMQADSRMAPFRNDPEIAALLAEPKAKP